MTSTYRTIAAAVAFSCAAGAFALPASAFPVAKQGVTLESPLVQQVAYWRKKKHCNWVKKVRWHHGHKVVKFVKVCR
jgi:hypothetical protein